MNTTLKHIEKAMDIFLLPNKHFQDYVNNRHNSETWIPVEKSKGYFWKDGLLFGIHNQLWTTLTAFEDYELMDIQNTDIVLDIGACTGGFALQAARKARFVYAVEPLFDDELKRNIKLNGFDNISVIKAALGDSVLGGRVEMSNPINYKIVSKKVTFMSFKEIRELCGGYVDFLKIDCEGAEWTLKPDDLKGIRRIEAEIHNDKDHRFAGFLKLLDISGFKYKYTINHGGGLIHAYDIKSKNKYTKHNIQ